MSRTTILIADDSADNRAVYSTLLRHLGAAVVEADNGADAVVLTRRVQPDLVLMDLSMPVMDGWKATEILRADPRTASIPVLAITACASADDSRLVQERGFDGLLFKPCSPRDVVASVERLIGLPLGYPESSDARAD
jgi:CheY-like chemotaxis protein